jgi:uncharacterized protein YodC (DUF2158 family)
VSDSVKFEAQEVSVREGTYFRVGDVVRIKATGEPLKVTVVSSSVLFFVRLRWYRRVWLRLRHPMVMATLRGIAHRARQSL